LFYWNIGNSNKFKGGCKFEELALVGIETKISRKQILTKNKLYCEEIKLSFKSFSNPNLIKTRLFAKQKRLTIIFSEVP